MGWQEAGVLSGGLLLRGLVALVVLRVGETRCRDRRQLSGPGVTARSGRYLDPGMSGELGSQFRG